MKNKPMRELHTLITKIKNISMDPPKRSDNYFESNREQMLSAKFEHFKQYHNQRKPTRKMLKTFFHRKMSFCKFVREYSLRQGLSQIYMNMKNRKKLRFRNFL